MRVMLQRQLRGLFNVSYYGEEQANFTTLWIDIYGNKFEAAFYSGSDIFPWERI